MQYILNTSFIAWVYKVELDHFFNSGTYPVPIKLNYNNERSLSRFLFPEFE